MAVLARSTEPEFIWCGNIKPAAYPAKWTMERTGTPFGILLHGGDLLILQHQIHQSAMKRKTAARAARRRPRCWWPTASGPGIAVSRLLGELEIDAPPDRVRVVPLGADHEFFRPGLDTREVRARYGLGRGPLAAVGRAPRAAQGHRHRVAGAGAAARRAIPISATRWSAPAKSSEALEAEARELGVADRVRFLTDVPDRDLPALYNTAEIYLGVSRLMEQRVEGFGISLAEASACGDAGRSRGGAGAFRPRSATARPASWWTPSGPRPWREAVEPPAATIAALRARLGAAGRRAVESHYNWDRVTARPGAASATSWAPAARQAAG